MSAPDFPIASVDIGDRSPKEAIDGFLKHREHERWVLLGQHAPQSNEQLWTAWIQAARNEIRETMVARSVDAEFLRFRDGGLYRLVCLF